MISFEAIQQQAMRMTNPSIAFGGHGSAIFALSFPDPLPPPSADGKA